MYSLTTEIEVKCRDDLMQMGYDIKQATKASYKVYGKLDRALDFLFESSKTNFEARDRSPNKSVDFSAQSLSKPAVGSSAPDRKNANFELGSILEVQGKDSKWRPAKIVNSLGDILRVTYYGYSSDYDDDLFILEDSARIRPYVGPVLNWDQAIATTPRKQNSAPIFKTTLNIQSLSAEDFVDVRDETGFWLEAQVAFDVYLNFC
jgi:hypothetical protein